MNPTFEKGVVALRPVNDKRTELIFKNGMALIVEEPLETVKLRYAKREESHDKRDRDQKRQ